MSEHADDIVRQLIIEFSVNGNAIGKSPNREDRKQRIRQAIYRSGKAMQRFHDTSENYSEAFRLAFNEPLDRRAMERQDEIPDEGDDVEDANE